jgi:hypothetical protein
MTSLPRIFIRSHHKVFSVALSHPSSRAASGFFQSLVACRVHARNASMSLRHVVRMQASVLCARPRPCMYTPRHLSYWRFRSAALRWNQRQKNFSFDMTPLAGFSPKTTQNRQYAAARILSKVWFLYKSGPGDSLTAAFDQPSSEGRSADARKTKPAAADESRDHDARRTGVPVSPGGSREP